MENINYTIDAEEIERRKNEISEFLQRAANDPTQHLFMSKLALLCIDMGHNKKQVAIDNPFVTVDNNDIFTYNMVGAVKTFTSRYTDKRNIKTYSSAYVALKKFNEYTKDTLNIVTLTQTYSACPYSALDDNQITHCKSSKDTMDNWCKAHKELFKTGEPNYIHIMHNWNKLQHEIYQSSDYNKSKIQNTAEAKQPMSPRKPMPKKPAMTKKPVHKQQIVYRKIFNKWTKMVEEYPETIADRVQVIIDRSVDRDTPLTDEEQIEIAMLVSSIIN